MTSAEQFWTKVDTSAGLFECWPWIASFGSTGYGQIRKAARTLKAHRYSWELHFGAIPEGLFVLHHCDNPPCVNPAHLYLGTQRDNILDMWRKRRHPVRPRQPKCKNGHDWTNADRGYCRPCHTATQRARRRAGAA